MEWTDELVERLRLLWGEGHSTAEIGRRLGVSKNAVVGKAHRLRLAARPSPIRRGATPPAIRQVSARRVAAGPTLPPLGLADLPAASAPAAAAAVGRSAGPRPVTRAAGGRVIPCCWPIGEPGTRSFRFCDVASAGGKPYCAEHAALAYVRIRDRREDAA